jgi:hypothetical protein
MLEAPVCPLLAAGIPRTIVIVPVPIHIDGERHHRYPKARRIAVERHVAAFVSIGDIG